MISPSAVPPGCARGFCGALLLLVFALPAFGQLADPNSRVVHNLYEKPVPEDLESQLDVQATLEVLGLRIDATLFKDFVERHLLLKSLDRSMPVQGIVRTAIESEKQSTLPVRDLRAEALAKVVHIDTADFSADEPVSVGTIHGVYQYRGNWVWGWAPEHRNCCGGDPEDVVLHVPVRNTGRADISALTMEVSLLPPRAAVPWTLRCESTDPLAVGGSVHAVCRTERDSKIGFEALAAAVKGIPRGETRLTYKTTFIKFRDAGVGIQPGAMYWDRAVMRANKAAEIIKQSSCADRGRCLAEILNNPYIVIPLGVAGLALVLFVISRAFKSAGPRVFWWSVFALYAGAVVLTVWFTAAVRGSLAVGIGMFAVMALGAPWSYALLFFVQDQLFSSLFVLFSVLAVCISVNLWLIWRQATKARPSPTHAPPAFGSANALPWSVAKKFVVAVVTPVALFLSVWYLMFLSAGSTAGRSSYFDLSTGARLAQVIAIYNCWTLFINWRRPRSFILAATVVPALGLFITIVPRAVEVAWAYGYLYGWSYYLFGMAHLLRFGAWAWLIPLILAGAAAMLAVYRKQKMFEV